MFKSKKSMLGAVLFAALILGCEKPATTIQEAGVPHLRKINLTDNVDADSLSRLGLEVIVVEDNYVIARVGGEGIAAVQNLNLQSDIASETDLIQRLVEVIITKKEDISDLSNVGIDIWEVRGDTVLAQAFDKYIMEIENKGYSIKIVEKNIQNLTGKSGN